MKHIAPRHWLFSKNWLLPTLLISLGYLISHLLSLVSLPVFADESIYIRWTQLIIDDPGRYLFFALNDGKTPLFMWLLVPFQFLFSDQLAASRIVAVIIGLVQVWVMGYLMHLLGGRPKTIWLTMVLTAILPFWFFHHRMALIDGFLTLWVSLALVFVIKICQHKQTSRAQIGSTLGLGLMFGLALWTKLPAILCLPAFGIWALWPKSLSWLARLKLTTTIGVGLGLGVAIFGLLALHPAFGQLFSRGSDFLYPWREVLLAGQWRQTLPNLPTYSLYFFTYLTAPVMVLALAGLFMKQHQRTFHLLFWSMILFMLPISILGKVVYPRYLLPVAIFATLAGALALQVWHDYWSKQPTLLAKVAGSLVVAVTLAHIAASSGQFMLQTLTNPNQIPFVPADQTQYLLEWSSGHGITETVDLINTAAQEGTIAVATEGYFGTLPDALLMYFHRRPVTGLYLEGIGQPVASIPQSFSDKAQEYDRTWLVVNSHRLKMELPPEALVAEFCRPQNAPCLQVWDITQYLFP